MTSERLLREIYRVAGRIATLIPGLALLMLAALLSGSSASPFLASAGAIFLLVAATEMVFAFSRRSSAPPSVPPALLSPSPEAQRRTRRLVKLLAFIGESTPTLVSAVEEGGIQVLNGWLEIVAERLERAAGCSAGAMVLREEFIPDRADLVPFCEVLCSGGATASVLPRGSRIQLRAGIAWDVGQAVGARSFYLAPLALAEVRYWVCLTFVAKVDDDLLQSICGALVAPVTLLLIARSRVPGFESSDAPRLSPGSRARALPIRDRPTLADEPPA